MRHAPRQEGLYFSHRGIGSRFPCACVDLLLPNRMKHLRYFAPPRFRARLSPTRARATFRARVVMCIPAPRLRRKSILPSKSKTAAQPMNRHIIWIEDETFTGWCCSHCSWGFTAPRLESTVAALAFNRVAQEGFDKHDCTGSKNQEETRR